VETNPVPLKDKFVPPLYFHHYTCYTSGSKRNIIWVAGWAKKREYQVFSNNKLTRFLAVTGTVITWLPILFTNFTPIIYNNIFRKI
jgi:hypothetical protein